MTKTMLRRIGEGIHEDWYRSFLVSTPPVVQKADVLKMFVEAPWAITCDLSFDVNCKKLIASELEQTSINDDQAVWTISVEFQLVLTPYEPLPEGHYDRVGTLDYLTAEPTLPEGWQIIEISAF